MTEQISPQTRLFLPQWITEIYYGGTWHPVLIASYEEFQITSDQELVRYIDPFDTHYVVLSIPVTGWKYEIPSEKEIEQLKETKNG